jgi:hypothetical protein
MLTSNTSVIDRRITIAGDHQTFPYETGWALEGVWFVQVEGDHPELILQPQASPDGINWVDHGEPTTLEADQVIGHVPVSHFGSWLRLAISGSTRARPATILTHLALKG